VETRFWQARAGRAFVGRLATGTDLVAEIERFCADQGIRSAWVSVVGAVSHAAFGYYEQDERKYIELASDYHHEITSFTGNISLRDGKPFLHAHAGFASRDGGSVGGHVLPGCTVFVGEVTIREMGDVELERVPDEVTGLALWPLEEPMGGPTSGAAPDGEGVG
jgi:predicted DNA-binding protein with PD1-like motif